MKNNCPELSSAEIPDDILGMFAECPSPAPEQVRKFDHIRDDFIHMVLNESAPKHGIIDAVVTWAGELIEKTANIQINSPLQPIFQARAVASRYPQKGTYSSAIHLEKHYDDCRIVLDYYCVPERYIEINLIKGQDNDEVRPMTIHALDELGASLAPPVTVTSMQSAPRFPDPRPGIYNFEVSWTSGAGQIGLEIKSASKGNSTS